MSLPKNSLNRNSDACQIHPEARYFGKRISEGGPQPVYKQLLPDGEATQLSPAPSQKLRNHSPDGFQWGSSTGPGMRGKIRESPLSGKVSYEFGGDFDDSVRGRWNFTKIINAGVKDANMDDVERHLEHPSESYLMWNVSTKFNGSIHQYSFAIKSSDKINKELIGMSREIKNIGKPLIRQVLIPGENFSKSASVFAILNISLVASCAPYFSLETEPIPLNPKVFILSPPIIARSGTEMMLPRSPCFAIDGIKDGFGSNLATLKTDYILWHIILLTFCLYYITNDPNKRNQGAAQLALALLLDVTTDPGMAQSYYQDFKFHWVAAWGESWSITSREILEWIGKFQSLELERKVVSSRN